MQPGSRAAQQAAGLSQCKRLPCPSCTKSLKSCLSSGWFALQAGFNPITFQAIKHLQSHPRGAEVSPSAPESGCPLAQAIIYTAALACLQLPKLRSHLAEKSREAVEHCPHLNSPRHARCGRLTGLRMRCCPLLSAHSSNDRGGRAVSSRCRLSGAVATQQHLHLSQHIRRPGRLASRPAAHATGGSCSRLCANNSWRPAAAALLGRRAWGAAAAQIWLEGALSQLLLLCGLPRRDVATSLPDGRALGKHVVVYHNTLPPECTHVQNKWHGPAGQLAKHTWRARAAAAAASSRAACLWRTSRMYPPRSCSGAGKQHYHGSDLVGPSERWWTLHL